MKTNISRFWRLFLLLSSLLYCHGCKTLNLNYSEEYLFCGSNHPDDSKFLNVTSPDNKRLEISDLQLVNLDRQTDESVKLSSKGCLSVPSDGRYMIRSLTREWANIFDSNELRGQTVLKLNDYSQNNISVNCDSSRPTTVSQNFSLQSIILNNVSEQFQEGYKVEYEVKSRRLSSSLKSDISLNLIGESSRPFLLSNETNLDLQIKIKNLLKNQYILEKSCQFLIDSTPPDATLATNLGNSNVNASIHGEDVLVVRLSDSISFVTKEEDVKEVRFCRTLLDDDFDEKDISKLTHWQNSTKGATCRAETLETIPPNNTISTDKKSGIWAFTYQAVDALGNISAPQHRTVMFYHQEEIELIKANSSSKVSLAVEEARSLEAVKVALDSERARLNLKTRQERNEAYSSTLAGLTNAYHQKVISAPFNDKITGCGDNFDISNDGKYIVCGKGKTQLVVWDVTNKRIHREFNITPTSIEINTNKFVLSGNGKVISTFKDNDASLIWNLETGEEIESTNNQKFPSDLLALNREGTLAIAQQGQELFVLLDLKRNEVIRQFPTELGAPEQVTFSPDDRYLLAYSDRRNIARIIDIASGNSIKLDHTESVESCVFTPNSNNVITSSRDGWVKVWEARSGNLLKSVQINPSGLTRRMRVVADDEKVLVLDDNSHFYSYRIDDLKLLREFEDKSRDSLLQLRMSSNSDIAYTSSIRAPVTAWFLNSGRSDRTLTSGGKTFGALAFENDGKAFYSSSTDLNINRWDTSTWEIERRYPLLEWSARDISLSSDEKSLVFLGKNPSILPINDENHIKEFLGHFKGVDSIAMSHDQRLLATCSHDYSAIIWEVATQKPLHTITNAFGCDRILFTLDDKAMIVHSTADIFFWDVATGSKLKTLSKHLSMVTDMGLFADGLRLYSASSDKTIRIWDIKTGENIQTIDTVEGVIKVQLSRDQSTFLVLHAKDGVSTWDVKSGNRMSAISTPQYSVTGMGFFPSGERFLTFDNEGVIQVWDQTAKGLVEKICKSLKPHFEHDLCIKPSTSIE
jgi:WD40 repeat protein